MTSIDFWKRLATSVAIWVVVATALLALQYLASYLNRPLTELAFAIAMLLIIVATAWVGTSFRRGWTLMACVFGAALGYYYFVPQWALAKHLMDTVFHDTANQQQSVGALIGGFKWVVTALCFVGAGLGAWVNDRKASE